MASTINHLIPIANTDVDAVEIRNNFAAAKTDIEALQSGKVDVVLGKGLSSNDYTTTEKNKLAGIGAGAQVNTVDSVAGKTGVVTLAKSDVGLTNVDNTADVDKNVLSATKLSTPRNINGVSFDGASDITINAVDSTARIASSEKGAANGVATLGADSKIPASQLPALAIASTFVVNSQAAQLALTTQEGDVAVRTDQNKSYIRLSTSLGTMADWQELLTPTDTVLSVNGQTGAVNLTTTQISEGSNLYHTSARVIAVALTGLSTVTNAAIVATDTILVAAGKLQAQITGALSDIATRAGLGLDNIFTGRNRFAATVGTWQTETFATTEVLDATIPFGVITATANFTFVSVANAGAAGEAQVLYREVKQDATGSRTASYNTTNFEKVGAAFPVLSTAANARDFLTFTRSQNGKWLVTAGLNIS